MSTKIGLKIIGKMFEVDVDEDFAVFLHSQMQDDFNIDGNNEIKILLQAYLQKSHDLFMQEQNLQDILDKCEDL